MKSMKNSMTRRDAFRTMAVALAAAATAGISGCAPVAAVGRVVLRVAWPGIRSVVSAIIRGGGELVVTAIVEEVARSATGTLNAQQVDSLQHGGRLVIIAQDGVEHEIPIQVETSAGASTPQAPRSEANPKKERHGPSGAAAVDLSLLE